MWFGLYKVIGSPKGHGRLECSCVLQNVGLIMKDWGVERFNSGDS